MELSIISFHSLGFIAFFTNAQRILSITCKQLVIQVIRGDWLANAVSNNCVNWNLRLDPFLGTVYLSYFDVERPEATALPIDWQIIQAL